ncbi:ABC transporter permease [Thermohalobaculum xanthum]|nr:ABC transporter permease [Thermohalobaculum xanthum]
MRGEQSMGVRRFGAVNWLGLWTLYLREVRRFASVYTQTILAPIATSILFMVVFTLAFAGRRGPVEDVPFEMFLAPGVLMMAVIQNAFANTSSSVLISKVQGNIIDTLMPPLSAGEMLTGYALGGATRGLACALAIGILIFPAVGVGLVAPAWALVFAAQGSLMLALLGLLAGIHSEKFDQMAAITNFVITPLSFLSGTFYSVTVLPEPFLTLSHLNPFFYLIDGFRHGVLGHSDADPWLGFGITTALNAALWWLAWRWLSSGYRLKG